jgi:hypothetical protein
MTRALEVGIIFRLLPDIVTRRRLHERNKGVAMPVFRREYPRVLKALLDRRRERGPSAAS